MHRSEDLTIHPASGETSSKIDAAESAMSGLLSALRDVDSDQGLMVELVAAWGDLSFDDRRYMGNAFPRLTNALLAIEDRLG